MALPVVRTYDPQFEQLVRAFFAPRTAAPTRRWAPVTEVSSTDEAYTVTVELPGVKREDVSVEVAEKTLVVTATRGETFTLRRSLPGDVQRDDVSATLADGVLTVTLPRAAAPAPRKVEITQG
ncbi:Hsp20/alpha crystallin family protein [Spongisporangium articulatum]|uniref:Hsp20/alpha crystallin family protein n=1 Tax=Spongisporangium articulatum TaxID=3362603 RepID=A0ABW8ANC5_9ACTN